MTSPPVNSHPPHLSQPYERSGANVNGGARNARYDPRMDIAHPSQPIISNSHQESPPRITPAKANKGRKSLAFHAQKMEDGAAYTPPQSLDGYAQPRRPTPRARPSGSVYVGAGMESPRKQAIRAQQAQPQQQPAPSTSAYNNGRYSQSPQSEDDSGGGAVPPVARFVDEDYDEGAADALMGLAGAAAASDRMGRGATQPSSLPPSIREPTPHRLSPAINVMMNDGMKKRNNGDVHDAPNKRMREGGENQSSHLSSPETYPAAFPRKHSMNTMNTPPPDEQVERGGEERLEQAKQVEHEEADAGGTGKADGSEGASSEQHQAEQPPDHEMEDAH